MRRTQFAQIGDTYINPQNVTHIHIDGLTMKAFVVGRAESLKFTFDETTSLRRALAEFATGIDPRYFPIEGLSERIKRVLLAESIDTVDDLLRFGRRRLLASKNVGSTSVAQVDKLMISLGHELQWIGPALKSRAQSE